MSDIGPDGLQDDDLTVSDRAPVSASQRLVDSVSSAYQAAAPVIGNMDQRDVVLPSEDDFIPEAAKRPRTTGVFRLATFEFVDPPSEISAVKKVLRSFVDEVRSYYDLWKRT